MLLQENMFGIFYSYQVGCWEGDTTAEFSRQQVLGKILIPVRYQAFIKMLPFPIV